MDRATAPTDDSVAAISNYIWDTRYRSIDPGAPEHSIADTWRRVAHAAAILEADAATWRRAFESLLADYQFLPGGRILAGAGTLRAVTLANCFVMGRIEDSITGIFETLKEAAVTMQQGGGVGFDFSTLRPRGSAARASGAVASGPVAFLHVFDAMCATIAASGPRRGAMMATLRCDHPDILEFLRAKRERGVLRHFNLSVLVTDDFLRAVRSNAAWPLKFHDGADTIAGATLHGATLWQELCSAAHASAEPGVLFIDRINATNNLAYREVLSATNPCGEAPLPHYGACHLGSLNLPRFVRRPFSVDAALDHASLAAAARVAVRFLDNLSDIARYPLQRQAERARATRRLGIGITGLGDMLAMLRLRYDSEAARAVASDALRTIRDAAYTVSIDLARERGPFPDLDIDRHLERPFIAALSPELRGKLRHNGIRNSHLLAIAPAGTISLLAGNVSSGIEPLMGLSTIRRMRGSHGVEQHFTLEDYAYQLWRREHRVGDEIPDWFTAADNIAAEAHLLMQAALQPFVDGAISKTVTLPRTATVTDVDHLYWRAHELGLKGCTVFRIGSRSSLFGRRDEDESGAESCREARAEITSQ